MIELIYPNQLLTADIPQIGNQIFIAIPFDDEYKNLFNSLSIFLKSNNYDCVCDNNNLLGSVPIINVILETIASSQYFIADISRCNANVFYELGIAQTLKSAENIFLIKEKDSEIAFDIQHLNVISYDKNNYLALATEIHRQLLQHKYKNDFENALKNCTFFEIKRTEDLSSYLSKKLQKNDIIIYTKMLNSTNNDNRILSNENISTIFKLEEILLKEQIDINNSTLIDMAFFLFFSLLIVSFEDKSVSFYIRKFLESNEYGNLNNTQVLSYQTDLAIALASNEILQEPCLDWIINYFQRSKSTKIDLNRYKLENYLMHTKSEIVDKYIINGITSSDPHVREHMSDIVGEKKLYSAEKQLVSQLKIEENIYSAVSLMEALGNIQSIRGAKIIFKWIEDNSSKIIARENYFIFKHARNALKNIGAEANAFLTLLDQKYLEIFRKQNII